jgi:hypothetical protein
MGLAITVHSYLRPVNLEYICCIHFLVSVEVMFQTAVLPMASSFYLVNVHENSDEKTH